MHTSLIHPRAPVLEVGLPSSQLQTLSPTALIVPLTSSPSSLLCAITGLPASPPSLTPGTSGILPNTSNRMSAAVFSNDVDGPNMG